MENGLKVHGKRVETNLVTGNLTSKVINIYETKNPSPSMLSILIYFQSLIQSEASDSQLATRSSQNSRLQKGHGEKMRKQHFLSGFKHFLGCLYAGVE